MPGIQFHLEGLSQSPIRGNVSRFKNWLYQVAEDEKGSIREIHYIFCNDKHILRVNKEYLQHDYYTDIITFPYSTGKNNIQADVYISVDTVRSNAVEYSETFENELKRVIVHGLLHMLGYSDKTDKDADLMREKENFYLARFDTNMG